MEGAPKNVRRPPRAKQGREAKRWDDPDSDGDGDEDEKEVHHPQTDQGDKEDDEESEEALKGSDSEDGGGDGDADLLGAARTSGKKAKGSSGDGLWDPLADLGPRKKRKVHAKGAPQQASGKTVFQDMPSWTSTFGFPEGTAVCLVNLQKAPQLNGQVGVVGAPMDRATGRCQIIMRDGIVKSLKQENLKEVMTGAVVRLHGLQGAAELNGRIAECGDLDLASGRYNVMLADGKETPKKVKGDNLELVKRYVSPVQLLSAQRRPFDWADELQTSVGDGTGRSWSEQLAHLAELKVPAPRVVPGGALASMADQAADGTARLPEPISADKVPVDDEGRLTCRLFAVSLERDVCIPREAPREVDLKRLAVAAKALLQHDPTRPPYFLIPQLCVKALPCLRGAATCAWPLYLQLAQGIICLDTQYRAHKAWCRTDTIMASAVLSKPIYLLPLQGDVIVGGNGFVSEGGEGGWLLSDRGDEAAVPAPADGQVLPAERPLLEKLCSEVLPDDARKGAKLTLYRL